MNISSLDDLLTAARAQTRAQRLLFVFAKAELPPESSPAQQAQFLAGQGGALVPVMCVDKTPDELTGMAQLLQESQGLGVAWTVVFVTTLSCPEQRRRRTGSRTRRGADQGGTTRWFSPLGPRGQHGQPSLIDANPPSAHQLVHFNNGQQHGQDDEHHDSAHHHNQQGL